MASKPKSTTAGNDAKLVRELADILNEKDLSEIEMRKGTLEIRVARTMTTVTQHVAPAPVQSSPAPVSTAAPAVDMPAPSTKQDAAAHPGAVKSPMVGTAYIRPSPDADQFVKVGDKVKEGETVILVEAMKTFNPIKAPKSGKIEALLVEDAQPVEFGEALFIVV